MKRKPIDIARIIINILNGRKRDSTISYNELKNLSGLHWETVQNYITLIGLIQNFAPKIQMDKDKKNTIRITGYSDYLLKFLDKKDQFLVVLFLEKIFSDESDMTALEQFLMKITPKKHHHSIINDLVKEGFIKKVENKTNANYFVTLKGKFKAQGILAQIGVLMGEYSDKHADIEFKNSDEQVDLISNINQSQRNLRFFTADKPHAGDNSSIEQEDEFNINFPHNEIKNLKKRISDRCSANALA